MVVTGGAAAGGNQDEVESAPGSAPSEPVNDALFKQMAGLQIIAEELPYDKSSHATDIGDDEALTLPDPDVSMAVEKFEDDILEKLRHKPHMQVLRPDKTNSSGGMVRDTFPAYRWDAQVLMDQEAKNAALARLYNRLQTASTPACPTEACQFVTPGTWLSARCHKP